MDPNSVLDDLVRAINSENWLEAFDYAQELEGWLDKGGFYPNFYSVKEGIDALLMATYKATLQGD